MSWGLVQVGDRWAPLERHAGGEYSASSGVRDGRGITHVVRGKIDEIRTRALSFHRRDLAEHYVTRANRRPFDRESDRWDFLDGPAAPRQS